MSASIPALIPRAVIRGNPKRWHPTLSPDGIRIAYLAPSEGDVLAVIEKNGGSVIYVLYADEGHAFVRPANIQDFLARVEKFLAEHLGGRYEPMKGERVEGSSAIVKEVGR